MAPKSPKKILFVDEISGRKVNMEIELEEATIADSDSDTSDASEGMNIEFNHYSFTGRFLYSIREQNYFFSICKNVIFL